MSISLRPIQLVAWADPPTARPGIRFYLVGTFYTLSLLMGQIYLWKGPEQFAYSWMAIIALTGLLTLPAVYRRPESIQVQVFCALGVVDTLS